MKDFKKHNFKKKNTIKARVLSAVTCTALLLSATALPVSAAGFSDVDSDATVSWAKASIDKMTDAGYIKGYEDGTFRPQKSISKIECLILMSSYILPRLSYTRLLPPMQHRQTFCPHIRAFST